jgi:hypothetical protein
MSVISGTLRSAELQLGSVRNAELQLGSVRNAELQLGSVRSAELQLGSVQWSEPLAKAELELGVPSKASPTPRLIHSVSKKRRCAP